MDLRVMARSMNCNRYHSNNQITTYLFGYEVDNPLTFFA